MPGLLTSADTSWITNTVTSSLDQSLPQTRNSLQGTSDANGHPQENYVSQGNLACTVGNPTASELQEYAGIIGSKRALKLRAMSSADVRQGDRITYDGLQWEIQERLNANSYSVVTRYLMTTIA